MEKKKILGVIGLLFLLYCSASGNYLNSGDEYLYENSSQLALIDLLICSVVLMIVPFIWRLVNKKIFDCVKGEKICKWNSIIAFIISIILNITMEISIIGGLGAVMYYFINKWLFVDENLMPEDEEEVSQFKCGNCGHIVDENSKYCPNCSLPFEDDNAEDIDDDSTNEEDAYDEDLREVIEENDNNDINDLEKLYNQGVLNVQLGQYDTASEELKKYIKEVETLKKDSQENWYTFSNCVEFVMYVSENEENLKNIIDVDYETSNAYLYLSVIDFEKENYDNAIKNINKSLKWNPNNINALFEKAENYKVKGDLKKYYSITLELHDKIYTLKDLAHYYRNLGYYFIEKEEWDLAKTLYLYSVRFENNNVALEELKYILSKSKNNTLPAKEDLEDILKENRIPTYISKNIIKCIKELTDKIIEEEKEDTNVGKFLIELNKEITDNMN